MTTGSPTPPKPGRYLGAGGTFRLDPPRLRTIADPGEDRHTTWFELFFDLVFAAVVSQLGSELARNPSAAAFGRFTALFAAVVWAWITYTLYANRFDTDDLIFRLAKSGAMLAIAASAFDLAGVMRGRGGTAAFAIGYTVLRWLLVALYVRARNHVTGEARRLAQVYIVGYSATSTLWLISIFLPTLDRCVLWAVAIAIDLAIGPVAWRTLRGHTVSVSHLTERFGTFFIIVLGGSWAAIANKVSGSPLRLDSWIVAVLCFVIALSLWWIYFDLADTSVVGRGALGLVYVYCHFPLLAGVAAFGVGTKLAIAAAGHATLGAGTRWALAGGIGCFALALAAVHLGAEWTSPRDRTFLSRIALGVLMIVLAADGGGLPAVVFVLVAAPAVLGHLVLEAFTPRTGAASVIQPVHDTAPDELQPSASAGVVDTA